MKQHEIWAWALAMTICCVINRRNNYEGFKVDMHKKSGILQQALLTEVPQAAD